MEYFITGGTGFLGRHLIGHLVDRGDNVIALIRSAEKSRLLPDDIEVIVGDITDKASMREGMRGVDGVFHLAAWYQIGVDDPKTAERVNVDGTRNVLELMDELAIPRGVYTSSLAVFSDTNGVLVDETYRHEGTHLSLYDRTKWKAHYTVAKPMVAAGLPLVIVMPGAVYGPGDRGPISQLWEAYVAGSLPVIPRETAYCWGHVNDTIAAHIAAMDDGTVGESYIIAGEPYTLVEIFELAETITGIAAPRAVSPRWFRSLSRVVDPLERVIPVPPTYAAETLRVLGGVTYWGDNAKATRELNLVHRPVEDGLRELLKVETQTY